MKLNSQQVITVLYCLAIVSGLVLTTWLTKSEADNIHNELDKSIEYDVRPTLTPTPTPTVTPTPTPTPYPTSMPLVPADLSPEEHYELMVLCGVVTPCQYEHISTSCGVFYGPSGRETYYNLNMGVCVRYMRELGYDEEHYPYWIRSDGAKMLGDYVMVAANWNIRPKGTIIETSLGSGIVVDTGSFVSEYPYGVDIAVDW